VKLLTFSICVAKQHNSCISETKIELKLGPLESNSLIMSEFLNKRQLEMKRSL